MNSCSTCSPVVISNVPAASPSFQDDEINMSWNLDYVPYMMRLEYRRRYPDLDEEMAELAKTHEPGDRHFNSALLDSLKAEYRKMYPEKPDSDAEAQAEYDAYMAAHPGLKEQLVQQELEEAAANVPPEILKGVEAMINEGDDDTVLVLD